MPDLVPTSEPVHVDEILQAALARTPARLLVGRAGPGYPTAVANKLRADHAAARDAVHAEFDLHSAFGEERIHRFGLFEVGTEARSKNEYLMRPDLGRRFEDDARRLIASECPSGADLQVVIGDGLSATAVVRQAPALLDLLSAQSHARQWTFGRPFVVRHCRVGVLNDVGDLLAPEVVVLLIGERPGLATAESLSAYLAYRPCAGRTDADRNLISNIHGRGVPPEQAASRIIAFAESMRRAGRSGVGIAEKSAATLP
ncbi:MAG TPA: ethanolamine ammonia-lyase subunit EutC [Planctomycetia bacterium]|nr:ethanolamine ammonia-lyase subunit EutC [Planctomycetia bacterium]